MNSGRLYSSTVSTLALSLGDRSIRLESFSNKKKQTIDDTTHVSYQEDAGSLAIGHWQRSRGFGHPDTVASDINAYRVSNPAKGSPTREPIANKRAIEAGQTRLFPHLRIEDSSVGENEKKTFPVKTKLRQNNANNGIA